MTERHERWEDLVAEVSADIPGFAIRYKDESRFQRFLGVLSFWTWYWEDGRWHSGYLDCTTTIYPVLWFASRAEVACHPISTLEHEWVHLRDAGTLFGLIRPKTRLAAIFWNALYLGFPHALALLAFLAFLSPWFLLFLLFLAPLPAPFRAASEWRAFARNVEMAPFPETTAGRLVSRFTGPDYYFMWPFPKMALRTLLAGSPYQPAAPITPPEAA